VPKSAREWFRVSLVFRPDDIEIHRFQREIEVLKEKNEREDEEAHGGQGKNHYGEAGVGMNEGGEENGHDEAAERRSLGVAR
jgi:hypothetical protein